MPEGRAAGAATRVRGGPSSDMDRRHEETIRPGKRSNYRKSAELRFELHHTAAKLQLKSLHFFSTAITFSRYRNRFDLQLQPSASTLYT